MNTVSETDSADRFMALVQSGINAWIQAGKIVSANLSKDPEWADKVHAKYPEITVSFVMAFDRIGRGVLHPKLLVSNSPGARRLRQLPITSQAKYAEDPLEVLVYTERGWDTLRVGLHNLTASQARIVFAKDHIRTPDEQRAVMESERSRMFVREHAPEEPFRVVRGKLVVNYACEISPRQLAQILLEISKT